MPQLRNLYRKVGFERGFNAQSKLGFGFTHDGAISNLTEFLALSQFNSWPTFVKDDLVAFLRVFDSGTAPLVGYQFEVDSANAAAPATATELQRFETRAATGRGGRRRAWSVERGGRRVSVRREHQHLPAQPGRPGNANPRGAAGSA